MKKKQKKNGKGSQKQTPNSRSSGMQEVMDLIDKCGSKIKSVKGNCIFVDDGTWQVVVEEKRICLKFEPDMPWWIHGMILGSIWDNVSVLHPETCITIAHPFAELVEKDGVTEVAGHTGH